MTRHMMFSFICTIKLLLSSRYLHHGIQSDFQFALLLLLFTMVMGNGVFPHILLGTSSSSENRTVEDQQQKQEISNPALVTSITQNLLTVVSFLIGTASFILGLSIQNASRLTTTMNKYFRTMILALVIPSIVIISYGVIIVAYSVDPGDEHYLLLLFALYVPSGAILFLLTKIHSTS